MSESKALIRLAIFWLDNTALTVFLDFLDYLRSHHLLSGRDSTDDKTLPSSIVQFLNQKIFAITFISKRSALFPCTPYQNPAIA